jgi:DNA repair photolyase
MTSDEYETKLPITRKSAILSKACLTCLKDYYTVNLTHGCFHRCVYCYANSPNAHVTLQDVSNFEDELKEFEEDPSLRAPLSKEKKKTCKGKKRKPVYFSTMCDIFQPNQFIRESAYHVISLLLKHGFQIIILTKGEIPTKGDEKKDDARDDARDDAKEEKKEGDFISLFAKYPKQISIQIGLVTLDDKVLSVIEPGAPKASVRLANIERLIKIGITPTVRLDPMFPQVTTGGGTDSDKQLSALFETISKLGVKRFSASYLFVRPQIMTRLKKIKELSLSDKEFKEEIKLSGATSSMNVLPSKFREENYVRIKKLATKYGLEMEICGCKNSDVTIDGVCLRGKKCNIGGVVGDIEDIS